MSSNGNLNFGFINDASGYSDEETGFLPVSTQDGWSLLPTFAPFNALFNIITVNDSVTWSTETVAAGQRAVVIRYNNIGYDDGGRFDDGDYYNPYGNAMSMDVLLYETPMGQIDVRYHRIDIDQSNMSSYQIGMQSDEGLLDTTGEDGSAGGYNNFVTSSLFLLNPYTLPIDEIAQATLQGTTITFNFTGIADTNSTCGALGYNFRNLSQGDLTYWDQLGGNYYFLSVCGAVKQPDCTAALASQFPPGYKTMVCQTSVNADDTVGDEIYSLAVYNPNAIYWQFLTNGVQATIQDGSLCTYTEQPRVSILNFLCDPTAVTANITSVIESPQCTFTFDISTSIACGNGSRNSAQLVAPSTLSSCQTIPGVGYSARWCPQRFSSRTAPVPQSLPNLVVDSKVEYAGYYDTISIGFNINLYGAVYSTVTIDPYGLVSFGPGNAPSNNPVPFPSLGLDPSNFPLIAPLWQPMVDAEPTSATPGTYAGFIGYSLEGTAPNRQFFVRFSNVWYASSQYNLLPGTCSFDVVLYENSTSIETRYYYVAPNLGSTFPLVVGMHGLNETVYTAVQNTPLLTRAIAASLLYSTITYFVHGHHAGCSRVRRRHVPTTGQRTRPRHLDYYHSLLPQALRQHHHVTLLVSPACTACFCVSGAVRLPLAAGHRRPEHHTVVRDV